MLFLTQMPKPHSPWAGTQPRLRCSPCVLMKVPLFTAKKPDKKKTPFLSHSQLHGAVCTMGWESPHFPLFRESWVWSPVSNVWQPWASHLGALAASCLCYLPGRCGDRTQGSAARWVQSTYKGNTRQTKFNSLLLPQLGRPLLLMLELRRLVHFFLN